MSTKTKPELCGIEFFSRKRYKEFIRLNPLLPGHRQIHRSRCLGVDLSNSAGACKFMKTEPENDDGRRPDDDAEIRIPNSPVFARLERRSDGIYCKLLSRFGPCPVPPSKMKAQSWEQAKADAKAMLTGTRDIMSRSLLKIFGK